MSSGGNAPEISRIGSQGGFSSGQSDAVRTLKGAGGIRYAARRIAARVLFASGASGGYRSLALRNRAVVLMYHRVNPGDEGKSTVFEGMQVSPRTFEIQMAYLRKDFHLISLDDLRRHLRHRTPFPPNSCLVTFDDGWKDNFIHAYPVMRRYDIPAVIFLSVGHIGTRNRFWQERIIVALDRIREASRTDPDIPARCRNLPEGIQIEEMMALPAGHFRKEVREQIRNLKKLPLSRIEPIIHAIGAVAGMTENPSIGEDSFLSWEEIGTMSRGGIEFGSHGLTHEILTNIAADEVRKQALESRRIIEERIQQKVYAFSYPNGDHDPLVRKCIGECGYEIGFGTDRGFAGPDGDPLSLKRVNVHDDMTREIPMFLSSILGMI